MVFVLNYCMKKLLFSCILLLPILLSAQTNFEGTITYKGTTSTVPKNIEMKMFFSEGKMKVKVTGSSLIEEANNTEIFNFKTGIHYTFFDEEKLYSTDTLDNFSVEDRLGDLKDTTLAENILGHYCKSYTVMTEEKNGFIEVLNIIWFPDSLKFIIPEKYRGKRAIETCSDGNMLFFKMLSIVSFSWDEEDNLIKGKKDTFLIVVDKIERKKIDESEFLPPAGYIYSDHPVFNHRGDSVVVRELTLTELKQEEEKKPEPPPPPPVRNSKLSKTPAKKPAKQKSGNN